MIRDIKYVHLGDIHNASLSNSGFKDEVASYYDNHPHNNGWAQFFEITDPKDNYIYGYPLMNDYFLSLGVKIGESLLIHSDW